MFRLMIISVCLKSACVTYLAKINNSTYYMFAYMHEYSYDANNAYF